MKMYRAAGVLLALATLTSGPVYAAAVPQTVEIEMMTWVELKAALAAGKTTALFYTGGTEQRGPQNVNGGHNLIGRQVVKHIAETLGNAIAMPVLPFSPAGADPEIPGDIGIPPAVLGQVLESVAENAILNGFKNVVLMGDSGGGQGPNGVYAEVAKKVTAKYAAQGARVHYADHPYTAAREAFTKYLKDNSYPDSGHAGLPDTSELMAKEDGTWVRKDLVKTAVGTPMVNGKAQPGGANDPKNGIMGDARRSNVEIGNVRFNMKIDYAVKQINSLIPPKK
jgi:creatinine amidohydrolase/Fe(II)-dependent formamide hydrolase-like protein